MRIKNVLVLLLVFGSTIWAQSIQSGTTRGFVLDASGASVPGAKVTISNETRLVTRTMAAQQDGGFLFLSLPPGAYDLSVEAAGFASTIQKGITVHAGDNVRVDVALQPAAVTSRVEVVAQGAPPVNTVNADINQVISNAELQLMLLPANDAVRMAAFLPGAANEYAHNGQGGAQNVIVVDGSNDGDEFVSGGGWKFHPPADAVSEFRVTQNGYSAEYGRASAARLEFVTKSGAEQYHGSAYWFHRNKSFNANNWGSRSKSLRRYNEFGYALGGPIKKEKIYFFWTNYFRRNKTPQSGYRTWPTQAQFGGDFSAWLNPGGGLKARSIKDPETGKAFPNNVIPAARLNKNALSYLNLFYPAVTDPYALVNNDYTTDWQTDNDDYFAPRIDFRISDKVNMYARFTHDKRNQVFAYLAPQKQYHPDPLAIPGDFNSAAIAGTYLARPRVLVDYQLTLSRTDGSWKMREPDSALVSRIPGWSSKLLYPGGNVLGQLPNISLSSGYTTVGRATGRANKWAQGNASSNIAYQGARHNIKFGFEEVYRTNIQTGVSGTFGNFAFDGSVTGDSLADLLLGQARSFSQNSQMTYWRARAWQHGLYGQDEIKVTRNFILTLGLRWESDGAYKSIRGQKWANWLPSLYAGAQAQKIDPATGVIIGAVNQTNGIQVTDVVGPAPKRNFAPRVAIAYAPWGNKTAFRAGYGMFFDHQQGPTTRLPGNPPFRYGATLFNVLLDDPTGGQPDANRPTGLSSVSLPFLTPRTHKYSFSFQQEISGMLAELSYIGSRSTHQITSPNINQPMPNADVLARRVVIDAIRPWYGFGSISRTLFNANGRYNSFQAQLKRPMAKGLLLQAAYTFQKNTVDGGSTNPYNRAYDAGQISQHHILSVAGNYRPEYFRDAAPLVKAVLNGWQISSEFRALSGGPLAVWMQTDTTGTGRTFRANWAGSVTQNRTMQSWFDTAAFSAPAPLQIGNSPVDAFWGPGTWNLDGGIFRDFKIAERKVLQYRFEAYNVLNHFVLNNPNTTFGQPTFGRITSKGGSPRNLQMALRFTF